MALDDFIKDKEAENFLEIPINGFNRFKKTLGLGYNTIRDVVEDDIKRLPEGFEVEITSNEVKVSYHGMNYMIYLDESNNISILTDTDSRDTDIENYLQHAKDIVEFSKRAVRVHELTTADLDKIFDYYIKNNVMNNLPLEFKDYRFDLFDVDYDFDRMRIRAEVELSLEKTIKGYICNTSISGNLSFFYYPRLFDFETELVMFHISDGEYNVLEAEADTLDGVKDMIPNKIVEENGLEYVLASVYNQDK